MIKEITAAYVRTYGDTGQKTAYVEWVDYRGERGRTEGPVLSDKGTLAECYGLHMGALLARAICHGIDIKRETW